MKQFYIQIDDDKTCLMDLETTRQLLAEILRKARKMGEPIRRGPGRFEYLVYNHRSGEYNLIGYHRVVHNRLPSNPVRDSWANTMWM